MFGGLCCSHLRSLWSCLHVVADLANPLSPKSASARCANGPQHIDRQPQHHWPTDKLAFLELAGTNLRLIFDPCITEELHLA